MTNEDKVLSMLEAISKEMTDFRQEMNQMRQEMNQMHQEIKEVRQEMRQEIKELRQEMNQRFDQVDEQLRETHVATGDIVNNVAEILDDKLGKFSHELKWTKDATAQNSMDIAALKLRS